MCEHHASAGLVLSEKQCEHCGGEVWTKPKKDGTARNKKFCSSRCSSMSRGGSGKTREQLHQEAVARRTFTCKYCGNEYVAKNISSNQYCSRDCAYLDIKAWSKSPVINQKLWGEYSKVSFDYTPIQWSECKYCSRPVPSGGVKSLKQFCNVRCWSSHRVGKQYTVACKVCGVEFNREHGNKSLTCSSECRTELIRINRRSAKMRRRAIKKGNHSEAFNPISVLIRDKWKCQACGCDTPKKLRGTLDDNAPELDHIIPISRGGEHTKENTQCLCRVCNILKADKPMESFMTEVLGVCGSILNHPKHAVPVG